jgi:hypothetical protein
MAAPKAETINQEDPMKSDRIFAGVYSTGISYADRSKEEQGDYKRLAFLPLSTLRLQIEPSCPSDLAEQIEADAASIIARKGQSYPISSTGQTLMLGSE